MSSGSKEDNYYNYYNESQKKLKLGDLSQSFYKALGWKLKEIY